MREAGAAVILNVDRFLFSANAPSKFSPDGVLGDWTLADRVGSGSGNRTVPPDCSRLPSWRRNWLDHNTMAYLTDWYMTNDLLTPRTEKVHDIWPRMIQ